MIDRKEGASKQNLRHPRRGEKSFPMPRWKERLLLLAFLLVLALLICNAAAGLASRLARGLAFAATAVLRACAKITRLKSLNVLHRILPPFFCVFLFVV